MDNRIKELREKRGWTQDQLAEAAGTSFQQVSRLENGTRRLTVEWMQRIAKALGVHPAALLADQPPNSDSLAKDAEHALLIRLWDMLDLSEKRMIASIARDKGIEILADKPKKRSA